MRRSMDCLQAPSGILAVATLGLTRKLERSEGRARRSRATNNRAEATRASRLPHPEGNTDKNPKSGSYADPPKFCLNGMILTVTLAIATFLGGIAAVWFFWDKIRAWLAPDLLQNPTHENILKTVLNSDSKADWVMSQTNQKQTMAYVHNPDLRFEMSHLADGIQNENYKEPWANKHPDPNATGFWCDLYFSQTLIQRFILIGVDGIRAMLPPPTELNGCPGGTAIQPLQYQVAKIHDTSGTLDEYIKRSGLHRA